MPAEAACEEAEAEDWEQVAMRATADAAARVQSERGDEDVVDSADARFTWQSVGGRRQRVLLGEVVPEPSVVEPLDAAIERGEVVCSPRSAAWARAEPGEAAGDMQIDPNRGEEADVEGPADERHDEAEGDTQIDPNRGEEVDVEGPSAARRGGGRHADRLEPRRGGGRRGSLRRAAR
jgi:hypothetical protein